MSAPTRDRWERSLDGAAKSGGGALRTLAFQLLDAWSSCRDENARLRVERDRYRAALEKIRDDSVEAYWPLVIARKALEAK